MENLNVRIVRLEPQRVASFHGFGSQPEEQALEKLKAWAGPRGYLDNPVEHRIFGFNNPDPMPGSPNYGYEFRITVDSEFEQGGVTEGKPGGEMHLQDFPGGLYAVLRLVDPFAAPYEIIPGGWKQLVMWAEDSRYQLGSHQYLEEHLFTEVMPSGGWSMDLYLPVKE